MSLATEHEVPHVVVSMVAAYFAVADLVVARLRHQPLSAAQLELEAVSLAEGLPQEQVDIVLVEVSAPVFVAVPVAGHRALLWPCATSEVLPDQKVTIDIFDAGMRLCTSMKSREEVTNSW